MDKVLALQNVSAHSDPLDDELCWSTCSSSNCNSSSVFIPSGDEGGVVKC